MKGCGGRCPSGIQGQSPGRGLGDEVPPEAEVLWKYTVKNAHFVTITLQLNNCTV